MHLIDIIIIITKLMHMLCLVNQSSMVYCASKLKQNLCVF